MNFLLGQYDEEFNNLFNSVGMQYLSDKKTILYFNICSRIN